MRMREYVNRLICRKEALLEQLKDDKLEELRAITLGEVKGLDLIIKELSIEFNTCEEDSRIF